MIRDRATNSCSLRLVAYDESCWRAFNTVDVTTRVSWITGCDVIIKMTIVDARPIKKKNKKHETLQSLKIYIQISLKKNVYHQISSVEIIENPYLCIQL